MASCMEKDGTFLDGVMDLAFLEDGEWVVVDYKTDHLDGINSDTIVEGYMETQRHYVEDMRSAFGEEVRGYLVFLRHGRAVEVLP